MTIEDEPRRTLADPRRSPPGWPDAAARVLAGIRRRQRRRVVAGAGAVSLLAIVATAFAVTVARGPTPDQVADPDRGQAAGDVVPWLDLPAVMEDVTPTLSPRPVEASCRTGDLVFDTVETDGAGGTLFHQVTVHNAGTATCTVPGRPVLLKSDGGGTSVAVTGTQAAISPSGSTPATIAQGERAAVTIETYGGCLDGRPEVMYDDVRLGMADGGEIRLRMSLNATCGVNVSVWHRLAVPEPGATNPVTYLVPSIESPPTVPIGGTLEFVVKLTNPSGHDISLDPCPNYNVSLSGVKTGGFYQLNCAVSVISARGGAV